MKKTLILSAVFCLGTALGASGVLQSVAEEVKNGMEVLESSAIQLVDDAKDSKEVKDSEDAKVNEKTEQKSEEEQAEAPAENSYWVGAVIGPIPEPILAHIAEGTIPEGKGICVMEVVPDSPAEKAGLKNFDVILKVNGEAVNGEEFVEKVRASEGKKLTCEVLRAAKTQNIDLTPAERPVEPQMAKRGPRRMRAPEGFQMEIPFDELPEMDFDDEDFPFPEQMREMLKRQREMMKRGGFGFRMAPGQKMGGQNQQQMNIEVTPNGTSMTRTRTAIENGEKLTVSVKKVGEEPAKVLVEWKDEDYETTEDKLEVIPEEIRGKVKNFLESGNVTIQMEGPVTKALEAPADENKKAGDAEGQKDEKEIQIKKEKVIDLK